VIYLTLNISVYLIYVSVIAGHFVKNEHSDGMLLKFLFLSFLLNLV